VVQLSKRKILTIASSNLEDKTKIDYNCKVNQFFRFTGIQNVEELIKTTKEALQDHLIDYTIHLKELVEQGELSPNTVPKRFKGVKYLLDVNYRENDIMWRPIKSLFPKKVKLSGYKPWNKDQIAEMIEAGKTVRNRAYVHFMASLGGRVGIHDHPLLIKHLVPMSSSGNPNNLDCYAVLVYAEKDETPDEKDARIQLDKVTEEDYSYYAFLTPEATIYLKKYLNQRDRDGEKLEPTSSSEARISNHR